MSVAAVDELMAWLRHYASTRIDFRLQDERRCVQPHVVLDLGERGVLGGASVPQQYGGLGLPTVQSVRVAEQLGAIDLSLAAWVGQNSWLGVQPIVDAGSAQQKEELLPALARGRMLASFALTEPAAGSDPNRIESTLRAGPGSTLLLSGRKAWIGNASWAGVVNVFAKQVNESGQLLGFSGCLVRSGARGYTIGPELLTMGLRAAVQNRIAFHDVEIGAQDILGEPLKGFAVMHRAMQGARLGIGAVSLGAMRRCLAFQHRYCTRRALSRGHLSDSPAVAAVLNESAAKIASMASLVRQVAELEDQAPGMTPDSVHMTVKVMGSELLWQVADATLQMLGARGYTESNEVARFLRDARVFRVFEGPTETLEHFMGALAGNRALYLFLTETLGAVEVAQRLESAVAEVRARKAHFDVVAAGAGIELVRSLCGRVLRWGITLAFISREQQLRPSAPNAMAQAFVDRHFEAAIADAVDQSWAPRLALSVPAITQWLAEQSVTDLDVFAIDEVREIEPELQR